MISRGEGEGTQHRPPHAAFNKSISPPSPPPCPLPHTLCNQLHPKPLFKAPQCSQTFWNLQPFFCDLKLNAKDTSVMINLPLCVRAVTALQWHQKQQIDGWKQKKMMGAMVRMTGWQRARQGKKKYKLKHHVSEEEQSHSCLREELHPRALKHLLEV